MENKGSLPKMYEIFWERNAPWLGGYFVLHFSHSIFENQVTSLQM